MEPPVANTIFDNLGKKIEFTWKNEKKEITIIISTTKNEIKLSSETTKDLINKIKY